MWLFNLILIIFAILIIFVISSTVIKLALFLVVRYKYENYLLVLPSFLSIIIWIIIMIVYYITLNSYFDGDLINLILKSLFTHNSLDGHVLPLVLISLVALFIGILLQALVYFTINIDYSKINGNLRYTLKKIFKVKPKNSKGITTYIKPDKLTFKDTFIASILVTSSITFITIILLYIGNIISDKIII